MKHVAWLIALMQAVFAFRVVRRLLRTANGAVIPAAPVSGPSGVVSAIVPVLNEETRLAACLAGLCTQAPIVGEILVVDGGSADRTRDMVKAAAERDSRIRLVDASPAPEDWNGKAWGLEAGRRQANLRAAWLLMVDADVQCGSGLPDSLVVYAEHARLDCLSVATRQMLPGRVDGLLHPALLATLVYRLGAPGGVADVVEEAQANGQCMLLRRAALDSIGWMATGLTFMTISRLLWRGNPEPESLPRVWPYRMYVANMLWAMMLCIGNGFWAPVALAVVLGLIPATLAARPRWRLTRSVTSGASANTST